MTDLLRSFMATIRDEGGQAIMIVAGTMTVMLLFVGLAVDTGQLFVARRTMQEAADAGAYAGAVVIYQGGTSAQAIAAATADVTRNGFTDGDDGGTTDVIVQVPASGTYSGDDDYVEVIISAQIPAAILPAISRDFTIVTVRAVAGAEPLNSGYAVISLENGDVDSALDVELNGSINITGAGILINSTGEFAATNQGDGTNITIDPLYAIDIAGTTNSAWGANTVNENEEQVPNPFAGYPKPSTSGMTTYNAMPADSADGATDNVITIYPGIYTTEIGVSGGKYIKMMPGTYIMTQGMNATGNATICSTTTVDPTQTDLDLQCTGNNGGVFLFNTHENYPSGSGDCDAINLNGNGKSSLFPIASGTYQGMLIYQDEACTEALSISGNGELSASGTIYLPNASFVLNGNNATLSGSQIVAETVDVQNGDLDLTFDAGTTAQPILPRLAE